MKNLLGFALTEGQFYIAMGVTAAVAVILAAVIVCMVILEKKSQKNLREQSALQDEVVATSSDNIEQTQQSADESVTQQQVVSDAPVEQPQPRPVAVAVAPTASATQVRPASSDSQTTVRYNKSFLARLIQSKDNTKRYFAEVANYLCGYGLRSRVSWHCVSFRKGETVAKLNVRGKSLCLYLALDPAKYADTKYRVEDASDVKRFQQVPLLARIRSDRAEKYAFELIDQLALQLGLTQTPSSAFKASDYPFDSTENLVARKLIKVKIVKGNGEGEIVCEPIKIVSAVTLEQAEELMSDITAATVVEKRSGVHKGGKKFVVNVDTLGANFQKGDLVNLQTLKDKKLVPNKQTAVKILARGMLDKALTVEADDFSLDAVKMIVLTGGKAIKLD